MERSLSAARPPGAGAFTGDVGAGVRRSTRRRLPLPAGAELPPGRWRSGQRGPGDAQGVQLQPQVALPELTGASLVADADGRQLLEDEAEVVDPDVRADGAGGPPPLEKPHV